MVVESRNLVFALVALLVGATVGLVTSVGGSDTGSGDPALNLVAHSAAAAEDAGTVSMTFTMDMTADGLPSMGFEGSGGIDFATGRGAMRMSASGDLAAFGGAALDMEMRFDGSTFYLRMPQMQEMGLASTPWISVDLGEMGGGGFWGSSGGADPTQSLQFLRGASDDVQDLGQETIDGVSATHYRAVVDLDRVVDATPPDQREAVELGVAAFEELGVEGFPVDVWIDDQGLPRRETMSLSIPGGDGFAGGQLDMDVRYSGYGEAVDVAPPPPDQVTDVTESFGAFDGFLA